MRDLLIAPAIDDGLGRCAAALARSFDRVVLADGEGARRLYARFAERDGAAIEVRGDDALAAARGYAAAGERVALLASGPQRTGAIAYALRDLGPRVLVVVPSHGEDSGAVLPADDLADLRPLLAAAVPVTLASRGAELPARVADAALSPRASDRPAVLAFSLRRTGLRRPLDTDVIETSEGLVTAGDPGASEVVVGAGDDLADLVARVAAAGGPPVRAVALARLRPFPSAELARALEGAARVTVIEPLPDALGDDGWLTLRVRCNCAAGVRVVARGCDADDSAALEEPDARDLTLMPLELRRRLDLAGIHLSLDAWRAMDLVTRAALRACPVDPGDVADVDAARERFARLVRASCAAVGVTPRETAPSDAPWDRAEGFARVRDRAAELGVALDLVAYQALPVQHRFALHHLAHPKRDAGRLRPALAAVYATLP